MRYRVARAARRLLGLAERGLERIAAEDADVVDGRVQGQSKNGFKWKRRKEKTHDTYLTCKSFHGGSCLSSNSTAIFLELLLYTIHKHQDVPILQFARKRADGMIIQPERNDRA